MTAARTRNRATLDVVPAVVLVLAAQGELVASSGVEWWRYAAGALGTAPLAVRRRHPFGVLVLVASGLTMLTVAGTDQFTVAHLLGLMLVSYTVASRSTPVRAGAGLTLLLTAAYASSAVAGEVPGDYLFATILLGVPWLAGWGMRWWRERADELARLASELAASREEHARLVVAAERGRIARDLHDSLAQTLNAVVIHAEAADAALGRDEGVVRHSLARIREASRDSLAETRQLLGSLRAAGDEPPSLRLADLDRLVAAYRVVGMAVEVRRRSGAPTLSPEVDAAAYRIVQESLTNARRHAPGGRVVVTIDRWADQVISLEVRNAAGCSPVRTGADGYGLMGMRERVALLGGELETVAQKGGFVVRARLPVRGRS